MGWFKIRHSGQMAKTRLKFLLLSDKAGCSPEMIQMIKEEMICSVSKYMDIETDRVRLRMDRQDSEDSNRGVLTVLCADIPIRSIPNKGLY